LHAAHSNWKKVWISKKFCQNVSKLSWKFLNSSISVESSRKLFDLDYAYCSERTRP
jgi:hypothetical protein